MAGHTPGPWRILTLGRTNSAYVMDSIPDRDGRVVGNVIATPTTNPAWEANARLIAAAPCLLAALTEFVRLSDDGNATAEQWGVARAAAVQAINAATTTEGGR
jgi:hypothetical protein